MYIKLSYCHGPNWMLRVHLVNGNSLDPNHKHFMYVLDSESADCFPYSVGHAGEGDELRHCIIEVRGSNSVFIYA